MSGKKAQYEQLNVRLDPRLTLAVKVAALAEGRTIGQIVATAIRNYVDNQQDKDKTNEK